MKPFKLKAMLTVLFVALAASLSLNIYQNIRLKKINKVVNDIYREYKKGITP